MHRLAPGLALTLAAALVPSIASAAPAALPPVERTLSAASTTARACDASPAARRGVARTLYRVPMSGFVTFRGDGATRGNWDLAVFDAATGHRVTGSRAFGSDEVAQTWVTAGQRLRVQGCHVSGRDSTFPVSIEFVAAKPPKAERPSLVRVPTTDKGILARLDSLGYDVTENSRSGRTDVVVPTAAKLDQLRTLGMDFKVRSLDLRKDYVRAREADARYAARMGAKGSPLPTGRTGYRTYNDIQAELAALVKANPGLVRPVVIGHSFQGREIQGIEIAKDVDAPNDGRPTFLLVSLHHAREWPSAETSMEFAHLLVDGYGKDAQITDLASRERTVIVPLINPDGFIASRGGEDGSIPDPADTTGVPNGDTVEGVAMPFGGNLAYRRKNCDGFVPNGPGHEEQNLPCYYQYGVDPNRNYGQNWGGVGASSDPNTQSYRGAGQWSEPETQAVWHWSQAHNVTFMMTLHNVAALVLRPPGVHTDGQAPDEQRMKELGDQMAADTGYTSQYGFQLYDTSGTTEDWQYGGQGAFGYTIEIGPAGGQFHMPYQVGVVDQWTGTGTRQGLGLRSALLRAAESAANAGDHSVIQGAAPAGAVLRIQKKFDTKSAPICTYAQGLLVAGSPLSPLDCVSPGASTSTPDGLNYTMIVPASNHYDWHVTPSTRPFVATKVTPGGYDDAPYGQPQKFDAAAADVPSADRGIDDPQGLNGAPEQPYSAERRFTVAPEEAGNKVVADLSWTYTPQDYDLKLYRVAADGSLQPAGVGTGPSGGSAGSSGEPNGIPEQIEVDRAEAGDYVARVIYYLTGAQAAAQANDWHLEVTRYKLQPDKVEHGREYWTLSCETADGKVLESKEVYVERGQAVTADFGCGGAVPQAAGAETTTASARGEVLGQRVANGTRPAAGGKKATTKKKASRRTTCLRKAAKVKSKSKRAAAVKRCKARYPTKAERRAAAKKRAAARKRH